MGYKAVIFMPDQFSKTMASDAIDPIKISRAVKPIEKSHGKRVDRKRDIVDYPQEGSHTYDIYSELKRPDPEMWNTLREALDRFNDHQDVRHSPYVLRLWAQNQGFRVQLIQEETGRLIKQTALFPFSELTADMLNKIINALILEQGVVVDIMR